MKLFKISESLKKTIQKRLLDWYRENARKLPWRETKDPYAIWVSEIMLQQTQVKTVIPYYLKWMKRFPSLRKLAKAPLSEIMRYWAGLGYYRRVQNFHKAARTVIKNGGKIPDSVSGLMKLPGIGRYTAGAIMSIAWGKAVPLVDGNVTRIFCRLLALKQDISKPGTMKLLWEIATELVPENHPGDFNQAMMELGATLCTPDHPACDSCPLMNVCGAKEKNCVGRYPVNGKKETLEARTHYTLLLKKDGKILIQKQPKGGRWGGLWMFPHWESKKIFLSEAGFQFNSLKRMAVISHGFTKYKIALQVYFKEISGEMNVFKKNTRWAAIKTLSQYAFPSPHQKIARLLDTAY